MKIIYIAIFCLFNYNAQAFEWPEWINHPLLDSSDNIRNKKIVDHSIGLAYQYGGIYFEPGNGVVTQWHGAHSLGIMTHATLNLTSRLWFASSGFSTFLFALHINSNVSKPFGFNDETNIVIGYDFFRIHNLDISFYTGFYKMGLNNYGEINGQEIRLMSSFVGGVAGSQFTFYSDEVILNLLAEMYLAYVIGYQSRGGYSTHFANNTPAFGLGIGISAEHHYNNNYWIKPSIKIQAMFANNINSGTSYFNNENGIANNGGFGVIYMATFGLGISWR